MSAGSDDAVVVVAVVDDNPSMVVDLNTNTTRTISLRLMFDPPNDVDNWIVRSTGVSFCTIKSSTLTTCSGASCVSSADEEVDVTLFCTTFARHTVNTPSTSGTNFDIATST